MRRPHGRVVSIAFAVLATMGLLAAIGLVNLVGPHIPVASAQDHDSCSTDTTIVSLHMCVQHAAEMGFIDNQGLARSLLAKLDTAQQPLEQGRNSSAVQLLRAFKNEVSAQAGKHIDAEQAHHMLMHADMVIATLTGSE